MRIAQVSPLYERVPPLYYGGTERIVAYLTDALLALGHEVTLFASGDSITGARLVPCSRNSLRLDKNCIDPIPHHLLMLEKVMRLRQEFDVIHFHTDYFHYPLSRRCGYPGVTTLHGRLDIPDLIPLYREYSEIPVVSISDAQRRPLPLNNWVGTVHHGLPPELLPFNGEPEDYLAFLGRISPEKGLDVAIAIAERSGIKLRVAAKIDKENLDYYENVIKPLMRSPWVEYAGEIGEEEKRDFLGKALALVFPIDWEEPFGLVMIEAMACGTPVVAFRRGSVPEVVKDGVSGYVVRDLQGAVAAVEKIRSISRSGCRKYFEENFVAGRMAADYLQIYGEIIENAAAHRAKTAKKVVMPGHDLIGIGQSA
jgi:glycosyltransferase involved in cell wall biosynthesis